MPGCDGSGHSTGKFLSHRRYGNTSITPTPFISFIFKLKKSISSKYFVFCQTSKTNIFPAPLVVQLLQETRQTTLKAEKMRNTLQHTTFLPLVSFAYGKSPLFVIDVSSAKIALIPKGQYSIDKMWPRFYYYLFRAGFFMLHHMKRLICCNG